MKHHRILLMTVILPTLLIQMGMSVGNAFVPLFARQLGASMGMAAFISSLMFLGQALADLPGGALVQRFGEKRMMVTGSLLMVAAMVFRTAATRLPFLVLSVLLFGVGTSSVWISRLSWMKREIKDEKRGYAMSFVGVSLRLAAVVGPIIGGPVAERFGFRTLFFVQGFLTASALIMVITMMRATPVRGESYRLSIQAARQVWAARRSTILAAAAGIAGLTVLRASRDILFPLWGGEIGLGESLIGVLLFAGAGLDVGFFWLSGIIMTRKGRKTAAVICTSGLALAIGLLPLARGFTGLILLSMFAGLANATGAGINLTISGDLAPKESPAAFLSVWLFVMGFAGFGGPALAAWAISMVGGAGAPPVAAAAGFTGAVVMMVFMRETGKSA
jgi:MFS family permease